MAQEEKEREKKTKMILRENNEAKYCNDLLLIYPLISYENQFKIEYTFNLNY